MKLICAFCAFRVTLIRAIVHNIIIMGTTASFQPAISPVDALWTLYQSQTKRVRKAFRSRILSEEFVEKNAAAMKDYEQTLSPETRDSLFMMADAVKKGAEETRQAAAKNIHVGRNADEFLAELEQDEV